MLVAAFLFMHYFILMQLTLYVLDNRLQLGDSICLKGKKKLPGKKITGFQVNYNKKTLIYVSFIYFFCVCTNSTDFYVILSALY